MRRLAHTWRGAAPGDRAPAVVTALVYRVVSGGAGAVAGG